MNESITLVSGIGESTKSLLAEHGFKTVADIANASVDQLAAVKGFGRARADSAIAAAIALLKSAPSDEEQPAEAESKQEKTKEAKSEKNKKDKNKKKNKKRNKKKGKKSKKKK